GYNGSLNNSINERTERLITLMEPSSGDFQAPPLDTTSNTPLGRRKINLPLKHSAGFTLTKGDNWMVGADFQYADWSDFQVRQGENNLGKSYGVAIGGQIKPDATSARYWNQVDYRLGFRYAQTPKTYHRQKINDMAVTFGMGFPLPETSVDCTFSHIILSEELGQQGTLKNNLVRERYININIGFTINDAWFIRRSLD